MIYAKWFDEVIVFHYKIHFKESLYWYSSRKCQDYVDVMRALKYYVAIKALYENENKVNEYEAILYCEALRYMRKKVFFRYVKLTNLLSL